MARSIAEGVLVEVPASPEQALRTVQAACSQGLGGPLFWSETAAGPFADMESDEASASFTGQVDHRGGPLSKLSLVVVELMDSDGTSSVIYIRAADLGRTSMFMGGANRNRAALDAILAKLQCRVLERT